MDSVLGFSDRDVTDNVNKVVNCRIEEEQTPERVQRWYRPDLSETLEELYADEAKKERGKNKKREKPVSTV